LSGHIEIDPTLVDGYIARCWSDADQAGEGARGLAAFRETPDAMRAGALDAGSENFARGLFLRWLLAE